MMLCYSQNTKGERKKYFKQNEEINYTRLWIGGIIVYV